MGMAGSMRGFKIIIVEEGDELDDETTVEADKVYFKGDKMYCVQEICDAMKQEFGESKD